MEYSPNELLERGQLLISTGQPDLALPFLKRVLSSPSHSTAALDLMGEAYFDLGDWSNAKQCFLKSVREAGTDQVGTKFMFLGQMCHGHEALEYYKRGVELLEQEAARDELRKKQLAAAHVNVAELFMSDLCMDPDAESQCEYACAQAQKLDPDSLEAQLVTASMRVSQSRIEEAQAIVARIGAKLVALDDEHSYDFRLSAARLMVEVDDLGAARGILERLVEEDDEIAEVWMLLGLILQDQDKDAAKECYERALELLSEFSQHEAEFGAMAERVQELLLALDEPAEVSKSVKKRRG